MGSISIDTVYGHGKELASPEAMGKRARELEELGFDGLIVHSFCTEHHFKTNMLPLLEAELAAHGWGDLQPILNRMTKEGNWDQLPDQISDEMLDTFAAVGEPVAAAKTIAERFGGVIDRTLLEAKYSHEVLEQQIKILKAAA